MRAARSDKGKDGVEHRFCSSSTSPTTSGKVCRLFSIALLCVCFPCASTEAKMGKSGRIAPSAFVLFGSATTRTVRAPARDPRRPRGSTPAVPSQAKRASAAPLPEESNGIRINKCFKSFASRRQSDLFISEERVRINGIVAQPGARVQVGDSVTFDGEVIDWERLNLEVNTSDFVYLKHWKDMGVLCTTDETFENNIISRIGKLQASDRVFPVGRLDESSTGLVLLTSDGRLPVAALGASRNCSKEYRVTPDMYVSDEDVEMLRNGVTITTTTRRGNIDHKRIVSKTLACGVERGAGNELIMQLLEGRNRQIRKMLGALGYSVRKLERFAFMGITLDGLEGPGDSCALNEEEMKIVEEKLKGLTN